MRIRSVRALLLSLCLFACDGSQPQNTAADALPPPAQTECLRACLEAHIEAYLEALVAGDPELIDTTPEFTFAENNQLLDLGQGSWRTMTGSGSYRHYFADPVTGQAAVISTMRENGEPVIFDLRLKIENGLISEIESLVIRDREGALRYEAMPGPPANFLVSVPQAQRNTREELLATTVQYFDGMENNTPNRGYAFFADDCNRIEHATRTTNNDPADYGHSTNSEFVTLTCEQQFNTGFLGFVTRVRDKRYMVIDEERQTVFGMIFLDHNGTVRNITLGDGSDFQVPSYFSTPRSLMVGEAWRVRDGKLLEIEMTLTEFPYGGRPQFDRGEERWLQADNLNPAGLRLENDCDRQCLENLTRDFLSALVNRDSTSLPLSEDVIYVENGQQLAVGDGLWGTATEINDYRVFLSNSDRSESGFYGTITETDVSGLLSAKLVLEDGLITRIDTSVMRFEARDARGGTLTLHAPQFDEMFLPGSYGEVEPAFLADAELDLTPQAMMERVVMGDARNQQIWLTDPQRGLLLEQRIVDVSNAGGEDPYSTGPYSIMINRLHKFNGSDITLTREVRRPVPFRMPMKNL